jgi:flagellar assembly protein FliH
MALSRAKAAAELSVRVNPADLPLLEARRAELLATTAAPVLHLLADARVTLGGCLIESAAGTLDARLELQLQGLFETLRAARARMAAP